MTIPDGLARFIRTLLQLLAGGAFTVLFEQIARDVDPSVTPYVLIVSTLAVNAAQNAIEAKTGHALLKKEPAPPVEA